jgi:septal ring factor EnvC (AmiA/AmiB activator)
MIGRAGLCAAAVAAALTALAPVLAPAPASAQSAAVEAALAAALIEAADDRLRAAPDGDGRLAALGEAAAAYEKGLAAMRQGLRDLAARTLALETRIEAARAETQGVLGMLMGMERAPAPAMLTDPGGPVAHLRAGHALAVIGPHLRARTQEMAAILDEARAAAAAEVALHADMRAALGRLQAARAAQAEALRETPGRRAPLPDGARAALADGADTLAAFARRMTDTPLPGASPPQGAPRDLALPVVGRITQRWREQDDDGIPLQGLKIAAPGWAQVLAPMDATVRYAGPLDGYAQVVILEPAAGRLLILAGMGTALRAAGDAVRAGEPIGQLGASSPDSPEFLIEAAGTGGAISDRVLYMEVREGGKPVDPSRWFAYGQ